MRYEINTFLEDGATNTEVRQDGKLVDRLYIGNTNWEVDPKESRKKKIR